LLFTKKSLTKTDRCAGTLSCRNRLLGIHFLGRFVVTDLLRRRIISMCISLFAAEAIPANYTNEFRKPFVATK
jgi:hypothetical protein